MPNGKRTLPLIEEYITQVCESLDFPIAGSSMGAIIAGILGVHSDAEVPEMLVSEIQFHGQGIFDYLRKRVQPEILRQLSGQMHTIMGQRYSGDVTISPSYRLRDYRRMLANPDPAWVREMILQGERATWPKISMIRSHARISKTLERCIRRLKTEQRRSTAELRLVSSADSGTS